MRELYGMTENLHNSTTGSCSCGNSLNYNVPPPKSLGLLWSIWNFPTIPDNPGIP